MRKVQRELKETLRYVKDCELLKMANVDVFQMTSSYWPIPSKRVHLHNDTELVFFGGSSLYRMLKDYEQMITQDYDIINI